MILRRIAVPIAIAVLAVLAFAASAVAAPAPVWNLDIHHNQTNFPPGGSGEYWFAANNVGDADTSGPITLKITLPSGITRQSVRLAEDKAASFNYGPANWSCPGSPGDSSITCTTTSTVARHSLSRNLFLSVNVAPNAIGDRFASAKIEGGGAAAKASAVELTHIDPSPAGFGILPESFMADFLKADGLANEREAGSHPDLFRIAFDLNSVDSPNPSNPAQKAESESLRDVTADLPPGFVGAPTAVAECSQARFTVGECPLSSQVGRFDANLHAVLPLESVNNISVGVFNLAHPRGSISDLGFAVSGNPVHIRVSLDPADNYAIRSVVSDINETDTAFDQQLTLWGVPADHSHDSERCPIFSQTGPNGGGNTSEGCSTDADPKPFLSLPSQCETGSTMRLHNYDSWQRTGVFGPQIDYTLPDQVTGLPARMSNCDRPRFEPDVAIEPTGRQANTPTGLDVHIKVAQNQNPDALATPPVKRTTVTLPKGMSFSPSFADGLVSCSLSQVKLGTDSPVECPDASRIGEVTLSTPLLPKQAEGSMYLAAQGANPFGTLFAVYLVLHDTEERGVLIKIPGRIDVDPTSGQITTTFDETPQFPFDELTLKFRSGPRAPLVNPPTCGRQTIGVEVASWAQPDSPVHVANTYDITEGPNGTPCPPDAAHRPFSPKMSGGTLNPVAGTYSPFVFRLLREDQEQELSWVSTVLPHGLLAKIAGIPACSDAAIASISMREGSAAGESANPACPGASQVGSISAGLGAGPGPNYFPGEVYMAGPYRGAPLSFAIVTPGLAGPFDLGSVVVRVAIYVDRSTAQVTAVSDPFPTILHGVILRIRDVRLRVDRPETTLNPTSCERMSVDGLLAGIGENPQSTTDDSIFNTSSPFQVGNCAGLAFKPKLALKLTGGTKRGGHPKFKATLRMPRGGANIARASVALPHSEFLDQTHIRTVCTRVQFAADECPAGSVYGSAVAKTPLFSTPLRGPVYLRSSSNPLPDLVVALKGPASQPIEVDLQGRIDSVKGGIRNTFDVVPDAPVEAFTLELKGGKKGLLVNSSDLCATVFRATARFTSQSGKAVTLRPALQNSCKGGAKKGASKGAEEHAGGPALLRLLAGFQAFLLGRK